MRTLGLTLIIFVFALANSAWGAANINLFKVEQPIDKFEQSELDALLSSAMQNLLVRLMGGDQILSHQAAQAYLNSPRRWVKSFQLENREADGVVIGKKWVVEFDRERLLAQFHKDDIHIWPIANRPKTLMIGWWYQQGLKVTLSQESLQYRVDLDYRDYARLLALDVGVPALDANYVGLPESLDLTTDSLAWDLLAAQAEGYDYILMLKADVIGDVTRLDWVLYSSRNGEKLVADELIGEAFLPLAESVFQRMMTRYSQGYRDAIGHLSLIQLDIKSITHFNQLERFEQFLSRLKPTVTEIRLLEVDGQTARYELTYQGYYSDLMLLLEQTPGVEWGKTSGFSGQIQGLMLQ